MGFWTDFIDDEPIQREERAFTNYASLSGFLAGASGEDLTSDQVLSIPTAKKCHDILVGSLKDLPIKLYKRDSKGDLEELTDDYRLYLLNRRPNQFFTGADFKEKLFSDLILHGNSYTEIVTNKGKITELWNLNPEDISISKYGDTNRRHRLNAVDYNVLGYTLDFDEVMTCVINSDDGVAGKGVIYFGNSVFKLALNEIELSRSIMENGSAPTSVIESDTPLSEDAGNKLKTSWQTLFSGARNKGKVLVLESGLKYKQMSLTPAELGLTTSRTTTGSEICRIFSTPEELVDATKGTSNVESVSIRLIQNGIAPLVAVAQDSLNRSFLTEKEKLNGYEFRIDTGKVLKTTLAERYEAHAKGINAGFIGINETRREEGMLPFEKEMFKFSIGNTIYFPESNIFFNPNSSSTYNMETGELINPQIQLEEKMGNIEGSNTKIIDEKE